MKEISAWVLAKQITSKIDHINDDDDDSDDNSDIVKKVDLILKFQLLGLEELDSPLSVIVTNSYLEYGVLFPNNLASEVQTPPPNI